MFVSFCLGALIPCANELVLLIGEMTCCSVVYRTAFGEWFRVAAQLHVCTFNLLQTVSSGVIAVPCCNARITQHRLCFVGEGVVGRGDQVEQASIITTKIMGYPAMRLLCNTADKWQRARGQQAAAND
jgi:hypothetical protein